MGKPTFTKMQQAAIDIRDKNILVSAAAGSGKTAVLVSRIIDRVLDENNPTDIDRILVMTFTRAAASQMKERILDAINEKRMANPHNKNLNRQYMLVHNAYIMTIDSFCMNVVRSHFEEIDLSPDFRMADEAEITLIKKDVLSEILEECYENGDYNFLTMTEVFAAKKTDMAVEELVLSLYGYSESYPNPIEWLDSCIYSDENGQNKSFEDRYPWIEIYLKYVQDELVHLRTILDEAGDISSMELGPCGYRTAIDDDISKIDRILGFEGYLDLYNRCSENDILSFSGLGRVSIPKEGAAPQGEIEERTRLRDRVKEIREKYKKSFTKIVSTVSSMSPELVGRGNEIMATPVNELVSLTKLFSERFEAKKREVNVVDFSDIEHMCLKILTKGKDTTAKQYRDFFKEIYVDEYQDSNFVQEEILRLISREDEEQGNVFMVGDVKQSIYGFRNAKPEIFIDKYKTFSSYTEGVDCVDRDVCIDLSHNFRSRAEVLDSVNSIFRKIMTSGLGGIEYDEAASLHKGREFADTECDNTTELNLYISSEGTSDREAEALMIANKIKYLIANMKVEDFESKDGIRPLRYSDIVILLRATKGWDNTFMNVLEGQGIPVFVTSSTGYFETSEVKTLLNFLKIIDNPLQDIPLAAVMMSVIGNFTEEEVAIIRGEYKDGYLYEALCRYYEAHCENADENSIIARKTGVFYAKIVYYRRKSEYLSVSDILSQIIDGEYGKMIKAMPGGRKRYANVNMLLKKAVEYGKTSYKGIFQFNRYIETIRKYEIDYGEANLSDENDNTVRIMSIHKSKGLEFPVCFVSGISKKLNMMDTRAAVLTDGKYGIATDIIDIERRVKSKSLFKTAISKKKQTEIIAEELRLLYVAMTRAKEKLILTGTVKDENDIKDSLVTLENASTYLDMFSCAADDGELENISISYVNAEDLVDNLIEETVSDEAKRGELNRLINECGKDGASDVDLEIKERLSFVYPYEDKGYVKVSVSQLKHGSERLTPVEDADFTDNTKYLYDEDQFTNDVLQSENIEVNSERKKKGRGNTSYGALHGTAVHRILELWDYDRDASEDSIREFLDYVEREALMEDELFGMVSVEEIHDFLTSEIAVRMKDAYKKGNLFREQPFVMSDDENDPESMLIQGVIDAYFFEEDKIVLVDYKTNRDKTAEQLKEMYSFQLESYGRALTRMLHMEIKESVIYSTVLARCISI